MRAAVIGTGRMGSAIAWAIDKLSDLDVLTLVDSNSDSLNRCADNVERSPLKSCLLSEWTPDYSPLNNNDIVVSAMPYHQNWKVAKFCIDHNVPYCDLGGHVETSKKINEYATSNNQVVATDLGLAPGWVNILAERGYQSYNANSKVARTPTLIEMMVGGLPIHPSNYLKYSCTWSYDGLVNEYKDQCEVLVDGDIKLVDGMSGLTHIQTGLGGMEAFYTSGGASHTIKTMLQRGVKNCHYKTIRYQGHCEAIKFLMSECGLSDDELVKLLQNACPPADYLVIIKARVGIGHASDWNTEKVIYRNDKFSAMQMATAFPVAVVATIMGNKDRDELGTEPLSYKDIACSYEEFESSLEYLFREVK